MTFSQFVQDAHLTPDVAARLELYGRTLEKWQSRINLVSKTTLPDMWRRHFLDSAQLVSLLPSEAKVLVDLGSGAGFPGLVLAIMSELEVHLVESDQRKAAFLREVARLTETKVTIHTRRLESMESFPADVITARALAPLSKLLEFSTTFLAKNTKCAFLKGKTAKSELTEAKKEWHMNVEIINSRSDEAGAILYIGEIRRAGGSEHQ